MTAHKLLDPSSETHAPSLEIDTCLVVPLTRSDDEQSSASFSSDASTVSSVASASSSSLSSTPIKCHYQTHPTEKKLELLDDCRIMSVAAAIRKHDVPYTTALYWRNSENNSESQSKLGPSFLLTSQQELDLVSWIEDESGPLNHGIHVYDVREHARFLSGRRELPSESWIHDFCCRHTIDLKEADAKQKKTSRSTNELTRSVQSVVNAEQRFRQQYDVEEEINLDETSFIYEVHRGRYVVPRGRTAIPQAFGHTRDRCTIILLFSQSGKKYGIGFLFKGWRSILLHPA